MTGITIKTYPIDPSNFKRYNVIACDTVDDIYEARLVPSQSQLFFPVEIGLDKGNYVNFEHSSYKGEDFCHIIKSVDGTKIISKASKDFSVSATKILSFLNITKQDAFDIKNNHNIGSVKFKIHKNVYSSIDNSGMKRIKETHFGFCFSLTNIKNELGIK